MRAATGQRESSPSPAPSFPLVHQDVATGQTGPWASPSSGRASIRCPAPLRLGGIPDHVRLVSQPLLDVGARACQLSPHIGNEVATGTREQMTDYLSFAAALADSLAWPLVATTTIVILRRPLGKLLSLVEGLQYKDFGLTFQRSAEEAREAVPLTEPDDDFAKLLEPSVSPASAVREAWNLIELTAVEKSSELQLAEGGRKIESAEAVRYLERRGGLPPHTRETLSALRFMRHQAAHASAGGITREAGQAYVEAAAAVREQIAAILTTPAVWLGYLTTLILEYNSLIDSGKYNDITVDDVRSYISNGTVLESIQERARGDTDLSFQLSGEAADQSFPQYYGRYLRATLDAYAGDERRRWGVENKGLCLLVAWTNEIVQQGWGWHPSEDVAGLHD